MSTPLHAALAELRAQRDKLDAAIAAIEGLIGAAAAPTPVVKPKPTRLPPHPNGNGTAPDEAAEAILAFLSKRGPASQKTIATGTRLSAYLVASRAKDLAKQKRVVITGATVNRLISLPGQPAKEVP